jgi:hypothetical protein
MNRIHSLLGFVVICAFAVTASAVNTREPVVKVPAGTVVHVRMIDSINSYDNHAGQVFRGSLDSPIRSGNRIVAPRGATVYVRLVEARSAGRIKGRSELKVRLDRIHVGNQSYIVDSDVVGVRGKSESKKTAKKAGIGALVGGGFGALVGGGTGAAVGAGLGAGAGVAVNASHEGEQVQIGSESLLEFRLTAPLRVR